MVDLLLSEGLGDEGGHIFVLEARPSYRLAHIYVVGNDGSQWRNYLNLRDLLRRDAAARDRYESIRARLAADVGNDRLAYTDGKSAVVPSLLDSAEDPGSVSDRACRG